MADTKETATQRVDRLVQLVLTKRPELTEKQLRDMFEQKKEDAGFLLNDEGAAFMVTSDLGVSPLGESLKTEMKIRDLFPQINDVTLAGRILTIYPPRQFARKDGSTGRLMKILVGDETGTVEIVFWNDVIENQTVKNLRPSLGVKVSHGYTRQALNGKAEIHFGNRTEVSVLSDEEVAKFPSVESFLDNIANMKSDTVEANVEGTVVSVNPQKTFERADGVGQLTKLALQDDSGTIGVVLWNEKSEQVKDIVPGDSMRIFRGKPKHNNFGNLELHIDRQAQVDITQNKESVSKGVASHSANVRSLASVLPGERGLLIEGIVLETPILKDVTLKDGTQVKVASFQLKDGAAEARVSLWRQLAEEFSVVEPQTRIRLTNVVAKLGMKGKVDISSTSGTQIEFLATQPLENQQTA